MIAAFVVSGQDVALLQERLWDKLIHAVLYCVFGLLCLLLGAGLPVGWWIDLLLSAVVLLLALTIANRARGALRETQG